MKTVLLSAAVSLFCALFGTPLAIKAFTRRGYGQEIRSDGPAGHLSKRGTPTMGGTVIITASLVGYLVGHLATGDPTSASGLLVLFLMTGLGLVGFADDFIKLYMQRSLGLRSGAKLAGQAIVGGIFAVLAIRFPDGWDITPASTHLSFYADFGISIGISGGEVIVGAPNENSGIPVNGGNSSQGFTTEGYVYIFNASAGALISTFAGPNGPALGDSDIGFGNSVAVSGNLTLIGTGNGGRAYVYDSTTGQLLQTLREPNPTENGLNGGVAVAGDVLVVGASGETAAGESGAGNVYLFNATTGTVIQTLSSQNPQPLGNFGYSLATNGEYLVVGAQGESVDGYAHAGHAYLFNLSQLASTATG